MSKKCEVCNGDGFILADSTDYGLRIERCDACQKFKSDEDAVNVAYKKAKRKPKKKTSIVDILSKIKYGYRPKKC